MIPALGGTGSDDSVAGVSLTGSMAGVAFDPAPRTEAPLPSSSAAANAAPAGFPSTGPARNNNRKDEGFLSPKDLAAAFKLNFSPGPEAETAEQPARSTAVERRRIGRAAADQRPAWSADDRRPPRQRLQHPLDFQPHRTAADPVDVLAAPRYDAENDQALALSRPARKPAASVDPGPRRPRRFRFLKVLVFLLVFGAALYATAMFLDPTLRQQSLQYYNQGKTAILSAMNGSKPTSGPATPAPVAPAPPDSTTADAGDPGASAAPNAPADAAHPDASPQPAQDHASNAQPAAASTARSPTSAPAPMPSTHPAADALATPPVAPAPAVHPPVTPAPITPSIAASPTPPPAAVPAPPPQAVLDPDAESQRLYREALNIMATDPAKAVAKFKAVKTHFPQKYWPYDLDIKIRLAEAQLKAQQH